METVRINGMAVNKGKEKGVEVPCTITFTGSKLMLSKVKELLRMVIFN